VPKLSEFANKRSTKRLTVEIGDVAIELSYRPAVVTPRWQKAAAAAKDGDIDTGLLVPMCQLVAGWDLENDDGTPVPLTPEGLQDIPAQALLAILQAVTGDMAPNPKRAGDSSNGSQPMAASAPALTGTAN
jgi:hypothetical protein